MPQIQYTLNMEGRKRYFCDHSSSYQIPGIVKPHISQGLGQKSPSPGRPSIPLSICLSGELSRAIISEFVEI